MNDNSANRFGLAADTFVLPTPAGAYFATTSPDDSRMRRLLLGLLRQDASHQVDPGQLCQWLGTEDEQEALEILYQAQTLGWVEGFGESRSASNAGVADQLHSLLPPLSSVEQGMIVDENGLALASCGLADETADALAALAADLVGLQERHAERLNASLGEASHAWAAVDAYGSSRIGAWPLYIGGRRVLLIILGEPRFNQPQFLTLVWLLVRQYG